MSRDRGGAEDEALAALDPSAADSSGAACEARLGERLDVDVRGLAPRREGTYEVWLLNSARDLESVGTVRVGSDGRGRAELELPAGAARFSLRRRLARACRRQPPPLRRLRPALSGDLTQARQG